MRHGHAGDGSEPLSYGPSAIEDELYTGQKEKNGLSERPP